ncbi:MAG TPA: glycerol-3-phosphate dehydrogenase/oxidase [Candidatus Binataceae bacterium]|nr:glycerol-3-phosphate dehydrogenase/oxidase [Candidatus Binataceae bacterium]
MAPPYPIVEAEPRERNLVRLGSEVFDLAIIGGGITGAAVARDAAMRGLKTALVDKGDFGGATSSRSSKLIHGGLRYLPHGQLRLVYHALRERERLRHVTAPHLVHPIEFLFPFYRGRHPSSFAVSAGLVLYDFFAHLPRGERHRRLDRDEVQVREPALKPDGLKGGASYLDAWTDDARITLENVLDAADHGAAVANYVEITGFSNVGTRIGAILARDRETSKSFEIRAGAFVNAAGAWSDDLRRMDDPGCSPSLRLTKGVHLVVAASRLPLKNSLVLTDDAGRVVFAMPRDGYVLIGTTDTDFDGDRENAAPEPEDIDYLLSVVAEFSRESRLEHRDVEAWFAGLRALAISGKGRPSSVSREEVILAAGSGLITVAGGKLTTHREIAEHVVDLAMKALGKPAGKCPTLATPLPGARPGAQADYLTYSLSADVARALRSRYGSRAEIVCQLAMQCPDWAEWLAPEAAVIGAEVIYAIRHEFARSIGDFIVRRTAMTWRAPGVVLEAAPRVARLMAVELGWDAARERRELDSFSAYVKSQMGIGRN